MGHGGKRANAGRPKGQATLDKLAARELARDLITPHLAPLIAAQIANAQGLKYLVVRDKASGKFLRVTEAMAKAKKLEDNSLFDIGETGFMVGRGANGWGYSLWQHDHGHIQTANTPEYLASLLAIKLQ